MSPEVYFQNFEFKIVNITQNDLILEKRNKQNQLT